MTRHRQNSKGLFAPKGNVTDVRQALKRVCCSSIQFPQKMCDGGFLQGLTFLWNWEKCTSLPVSKQFHFAQYFYVCVCVSVYVYLRELTIHKSKLVLSRRHIAEYPLILHVSREYRGQTENKFESRSILNSVSSAKSTALALSAQAPDFIQSLRERQVMNCRRNTSHLCHSKYNLIVS